jgi:hypothetical protein
MKLRIDCPECFQTGKASTVQVEPTNEGRFEATCDAGHHFNISILYNDFQILFEIGINAIHDGLTPTSSAKRGSIYAINQSGSWVPLSSSIS